MIENKNRNQEEAQSIKVAEESRETDWKSKSFMASMFMGELDLSLAFPYPEQPTEDRAIGDEICARVNAWASQHVDGEAIDRDQQIPASVFRGLNELGLFGIKIPKKYGGLGLSQTNYMRILGVVGRHCGAVVSTLSAHQSIGVPQPLKLFGTEEQKQRFLPRIAKGAVTAFGLTEPSVGSDPANMKTEAVLSEDGEHWVLNGEKLWCTNGVIADLFVVMARTPSVVVRGKERRQITAFIVDGRSEGVDVLHRCSFVGIRGIENGVIRFTDVKVPLDNVILGEGKGLKLALTTLNDGRLGIPAVCAAMANQLVEMSAQWAKTREQWGKKVGEHEAGADKLARISAGAYAMETLALFGAAQSDRGGVDIRMEAATAKMYNSEVFWELVDDALQLRAGRGFEQPLSLRARGEHDFPIERTMRDARINRIVEGTTDVMHLFLAREALDGHLSRTGTLFTRASLGEKLATVAKAATFYPFWYARLWVGGLFTSFGSYDRRLAKVLRYVDANSRKLARTLFHQMVLKGPKLEMRQLTLARLVDIGAELAVLALMASRAQTELGRGQTENLAKVNYWFKARKAVIEELFKAVGSNSDAEARALATQLMDGVEALPQLHPPALQPMEREFGSDLASGKQQQRLPRDGRPAREEAAK